MAKRIIAYFLFGIGTIIYIFSAKYTGALPYRIIFWATGIIMYIIGYRIIKYGPSFRKQKALKRLQEIISDLKENGEKIVVDLSKCEIRENNYYENEEEWDDIDSADFLSLNFARQFNFLNQLAYNPIRAKDGEIDQTELLYVHNHKGVEEKFHSNVIPRSSDDLRIKLYLVKTTSLYVDKKDRSRYYFDLDFLKREE